MPDFQTQAPKSSARWWAVLGPGILFASTAIGVSHLVQSTRAGAIAGFGLLWAVVAANVAKYPFFEFGSRYANATGESLIEGYRRLGKPAAWTYFLIASGTCIFVMGAVGIVTAAFLDNLFSVSHILEFNATPGLAVVVLGSSSVLLSLGEYRALDSVIKLIAGVLLVSTVGAFVMAVQHTSISAVPDMPAEFDPWSGAGFAFIIALMGWMPTAVDLSTWNSIWTLERIKQTGYHPPLQATLREFNFGYWASAVLAILFLSMGALLLFAQEVTLPEGTAAFAAGVVNMYTAIIGNWSWWLIAAAAFSAMLGTCIACLDGYGRALARSFFSLRDVGQSRSLQQAERTTLFIVTGGALVLILAFPSDIRTLVDLATTLSFLVAPVVAGANWYLVSRHSFPGDARPPRWLHVLAALGMLFLIGFTGMYFVALN